MRKVIVFLLMSVAFAFADRIDYELYNVTIDDNFVLQDFVLWSDADNFWYIYGRLQNTTDFYFKNVLIHYDFYLQGNLVYQDNTFIDYYNFSDKGMQSHSFALFLDLVRKTTFDEIRLRLTYIQDSGVGFVFLEHALKLMGNEIIPNVNASRFSKWSGSVQNISNTTLHAPSVFCCAFRDDKIITISEANLALEYPNMQPDDVAEFVEMIELPSSYDSLKFYTHYEVDLTGSVELPVELALFTGRQVDNSIQLEWMTESETNNYGFYVEKQIAAASWEKLQFLAGKQTTTQRQQYSFTDENCQPGENIYRLLQMDTDGTQNYSASITVHFTIVPQKFALLQNYPNPFNCSTCIEYSLAQQTNVDLTVYNAAGAWIQNFVHANQLTGTYKVNVTLLNEPSGVYYYKLSCDDYTKTGTMLLIK